MILNSCEIPHIKEINGESYIMICVAILRLTSLEGLIDDDHERAQTCIIFSL